MYKEVDRQSDLHHDQSDGPLSARPAGRDQQAGEPGTPGAGPGLGAPGGGDRHVFGGSDSGPALPPLSR